jgi:hypothetical protein
MDAVSLASLRKILQAPLADQVALSQLITNLYRPRIMVIPDTTLTIGPDHAGALLRFTSATPVAVTLPPTGFEPGFNFRFFQYGVGIVSFYGSASVPIVTSRAVSGFAMYLDTGEWTISPSM